LENGWPLEVLAFRLTNSPSSGSSLNFWDIIDNISEMVQDRDIVPVED